MTDSATLTGGFSPTGTITFDLFAPGVVLPIDTESVNVTGNGTYTTPNGYTLPTSGPVAGTYQWVATYSGDDNNIGVASASGDEPVVVVPATLLISTFPDPSDGTLSDAPLPNLTDTATLTGGFNETGTITFELFGPGGLGNIYTDTQPVTGDGTYTTTFTPPTPDPGTPITGTYGWVVSYSGDDNNNPVASLIGNEWVSSTRPTPASAPTPSPSSDANEREPASLDRHGNALGRVRGDRDDHFQSLCHRCRAAHRYRKLNVTGNGTYTTPNGYTLPTSGPVAGTYQWVATYSGDDNNIGVAGASGDEPVVVDPATLLLSTFLDPSDVTLSNGLPPIISDSAMLTGSYHATGTITFDLYGPALTPLYTDTQLVTGDGTYITTFTPSPHRPGSRSQEPTTGSSPTAATTTTTPWSAVSATSRARSTPLIRASAPTLSPLK